jgi:putative ABC transport system ATP-binding protein
MLNLSNISHSFQSGDLQNKVLDNVSLTFSKNEFVVILGANGSGKSTLLNLIAGNTPPEAGQIFIDNKEINHLKDFQRSPWIARVFQDPLSGTVPELSILENLRLAATRTSGKSLTINTGSPFKELAAERIAELGLRLENRMNQPVGQLSGGQRQAITLIMATMAQAELLLMDEPTAALDPKTAKMIMELAEKLHQNFGFTTLMVTHNLKDAIQFGSRLIMLKNGKINKDLNHSQKKNLSIVELMGWFEE